jgi:RNA polymerase sigma-70 factor, ECF subfamily
VRAYHGAVLGYVHTLVPNIQEAEDLTQETFLRAYLALPRIGPPENPHAWLFRIATNLTVDSVRQRQRHGVVALTRLRYRLRGESYVATAVEAGDAIQRAMATLPPQDQAILMLFAHVGLSAAEVAEVLDTTPSVVRKRRQRAREAFSRAYQEQTR